MFDPRLRRSPPTRPLELAAPVVHVPESNRLRREVPWDLDHVQQRQLSVPRLRDRGPELDEVRIVELPERGEDAGAPRAPGERGAGAPPRGATGRRSTTRPGPGTGSLPRAAGTGTGPPRGGGSRPRSRRARRGRGGPESRGRLPAAAAPGRRGPRART